MLWQNIFLISLAIWLDLANCLTERERFREDLSLRSLHDGRLAAHFSFETVLKNATPRTPEALQEDDVAQHYALFPLTLGQILREYAVTELHLTLNAGKWDYTNWGYPEEPGIGTGAELWAWMGDGAPVSVETRWKGLRNSLAGLFCASLASMDEQRTTSPKYAFQPQGDFPRLKRPHRLRHATLPSESVCTENLTPFLKLLPCKASSGIAHLLNPHKLFDADWHGMGVHVHWDENEGVVVRLSFQAVFDPVRTSNQRKREWSLRSLFDRDVNIACPVASESVIQVSLPSSEAYAIVPEPHRLHDGLAYYDVARVRDLDVAMRWPENAFEYKIGKPKTPLTDLTIQRVLTGSTTSRGQLSVSIINHRDVEMQAVYVETLPWHVQLYLHTMKTSVDGVTRDDILSKMSYVLPVAHGRPMLFESILTLPPKSTLNIQFDVSKSFLRYTEHSPDAHRGWDLPPALLAPVRLIDNGTHHTKDAYKGSLSQIMYSPVLLVDLATPDFSMPYNVIIMSSTLIALVFGSIFNLVTRQFKILKI